MATDSLWLMYKWAPGLTKPMDGASGVALNVDLVPIIFPVTWIT